MSPSALLQSPACAPPANRRVGDRHQESAAQRAAFAGARRAERRYATQLRAISRVIGHIINLFPPGGHYCPADPDPSHHQPDPLVAPCYPASGPPTCWEACPYLCPGTVDGMIAPNTCVYPPEAPIQYPPART